MKWLLFPFTALWKLMTIILELTGRMLAIIMGTLFIAAGYSINNVLNYHELLRLAELINMK